VFPGFVLLPLHPLIDGTKSQESLS
jgi:hypothetical protein